MMTSAGSGPPGSSTATILRRRSRRRRLRRLVLAVLLLAATLSVPVAGTALMLMDPYLTARSLSTQPRISWFSCGYP